MVKLISYMEETWREQFATAETAPYVVVVKREREVPDELWERYVLAEAELSNAYSALESAFHECCVPRDD